MQFSRVDWWTFENVGKNRRNEGDKCRWIRRKDFWEYILEWINWHQNNPEKIGDFLSIIEIPYEK